MPDYAELDSLVAETAAFRRQLMNFHEALKLRGFELESAKSWLEWCESSLPELDDLRRRFGEFNFQLVDEEAPETVRIVFLQGLVGLDACREGVELVREMIKQVVLPLLEIERPPEEGGC